MFSLLFNTQDDLITRNNGDKVDSNPWRYNSCPFGCSHIVHPFKKQNVNTKKEIYYIIVIGKVCNSCRPTIDQLSINFEQEENYYCSR